MQAWPRLNSTWGSCTSTASALSPMPTWAWTTSTSPPTKSTGIYCLLELEEHSFVHRAFITRKEPDIAPKTDLLRISPRSEKPTPDWAATTTRVCTARRRSEEPDIDHKRALEHPQKRPTHSLAALRDACYWLGCYYYTGMHSEEKVDPDFAQAYRVWAKAAEMGCAESRHNQACMLLTGQVGDAAKEPCEAAKEPFEEQHRSRRKPVQTVPAMGCRGDGDEGWGGRCRPRVGAMHTAKPTSRLMTRRLL